MTESARAAADAAGDEQAEIQRQLDRENPATAHLRLSPSTARFVWWGALAFTGFQLYISVFPLLTSLAVRSIHVGFLLMLIFVLFGRLERDDRSKIPVYDWVLAIGAFALSLYQPVFEATLRLRDGDPTLFDLVVGVVLLGLVVEAARRVMGWFLPIMCLVFIPYALWGRAMPGVIAHRGYDFDQIIGQLIFGVEGIYGTPTYVSATFIFLFILFGAFLEKAGMIRVFNDIALGTVGWAKGGPAKVAVVSSGLMGTINGSGIANVLTTGQFTIPLMIRFGYRPHYAGAVEATASMGGQIMPPVMGAAAFIMAERLGISYVEVALAAVVPAVLYFGSAFWMVHLEAGKRGLTGLPPDQIPSVVKALRSGWALLLPLGALIVLLFSGYTPLFAGVVGIACTLVLILGTEIGNALGTLTRRIVFWVGLGLIAAMLYGVAELRTEQGAIALVVVCVGIVAARRGTRPALGLLLNAMVDAAKSALGVGIACALVGILLGMLSLTGLDSRIAGLIVQLAQGEMWLALFLTMVACIVLGTGLPTTANYIITSSIAAPALEPFGVPPIVTHMFCFYFGIMSDLTPPVALAALAASSICKAGHMEIGWTATLVAMAGYVVPFMAAYDPSLMLQGDGGVVQTGYAITKAVVGIGFLGAFLKGYLIRPMTWPERLAAFAVATLLIFNIAWTDQVGLALGLALVVWQWIRNRRAAAVAA